MELKLVSAVSSRREVSNLFNRVAIMILLYSGIIVCDSLYVTCLDRGIGIYNGLFHSTVITHSFELFINIIGVIILLFSESFVNSDPVLLAVTPIVVYSNADLAKQSIIKENKGKSGIYRWVNKESVKSYVGSSVNLSNRFKQYYCYNHIADPARNMPINRGLLKYGYSNFKLEILEYCDPKNVVQREQYYLDLFQPEYNILKTAGSSLGFKHTEETLAKFRVRKHSEETLAKFRVRSHSEETKQKMSEAKLGISLSEDTRRRMSEAKSSISEETRRRMSEAKLGVSLSEYTRIRMSEAKKGIAKTEGSGRPSVPIEVLDLETGIKTTYDSMGEVARALGTCRSSISQYFSRNQQKPFKKRYWFYYL
jgi:group I intron endonuclease